MMVTTSPRVTSRSTPFRTRLLPKDFPRPRIRTTMSAGIWSVPDIGKASLESAAGTRQAVVDREVDERADDIDRHRLGESAREPLLSKQQPQATHQAERRPGPPPGCGVY